MATRIEQTRDFLWQQLGARKDGYLARHPADKNYRFEHSCRVANIGRQIARAEGLDEEGLVIACLLHDVAYGIIDTLPRWQDHGRASAKIARPFLEGLGLEPPRIAEICFGIAIHEDGKADFEGAYTAFACSVGDADAIDRFDVYRLYENLQAAGFSELPLAQKQGAVRTNLERLAEYKNLERATPTATALWRAKLVFQLKFYEKLAAQLRASELQL